MMMFQDLRGCMLSTAASLKLLIRGRNGRMDVEARGKLQEISDNVDKLILFTEEFVNQAMARQLDVVRPILARRPPLYHGDRLAKVAKAREPMPPKFL